MRHGFEEILSGYALARANKEPRKNHELWPVFKQLAGAIEATDPVRTRTDLKVKPSVGQDDKLAAVPTIVIRDTRETKTTQRGVYCVYLFREDMSGVYLAFAQGAQQFKNRYGGRVKGRPYLQDRVEELQQYCRGLPEHGFSLDAPDLYTENPYGKDYEDSTIAHKFYPTGSIPPDSVLAQDLEAVLTVYDRYLERETSGVEGGEGPLSGSKPAAPGDYAEPLFQEILAAVEKTGLRISERSLRRYHLGLKTRGFVILSGVSGTGKTWLTEAYAGAVGAKHLVVPVAPNWTTNEDLLGYFNPLDNHYHDTDFSRFLRDASREYEAAQDEGRTARPYHLVLDEMNLARVEYYFARFLSAMEVRARYGIAMIELGPKDHVHLPPNLRFAGTVNVDESTHGFADRVYDRAQLIELEASREALLEHIGEASYREVLIQVWDVVHPIAPFAFRTLDEIAAYVDAAEALSVTWQEALDEQLLQKVLPKLKGTDIRVNEALEWLVKFTDATFLLSHTKVTKMLEEFRQHGFASYF